MRVLGTSQKKLGLIKTKIRLLPVFILHHSKFLDTRVSSNSHSLKSFVWGLSQFSISEVFVYQYRGCTFRPFTLQQSRLKTQESET